jgi:hypothetical protein
MLARGKGTARAGAADWSRPRVRKWGPRVSGSASASP